MKFAQGKWKKKNKKSSEFIIVMVVTANIPNNAQKYENLH